MNHDSVVLWEAMWDIVGVSLRAEVIGVLVEEDGEDLWSGRFVSVEMFREDSKEIGAASGVVEEVMPYFEMGTAVPEGNLSDSGVEIGGLFVREIFELSIKCVGIDVGVSELSEGYSGLCTEVSRTFARGLERGVEDTAMAVSLTEV